MSDDMFEFNFDTRYLTNMPYFDINYAIEEYGFDFENICLDNFEDYIKGFCHEYHQARIHYYNRDYFKFKIAVHAMKNNSGCIGGTYLSNVCNVIQTNCCNINILEKEYCLFVFLVTQTFNKLYQMSLSINIPISEKYLNQMNDLNSVLNNLESINVRKEIEYLFENADKDNFIDEIYNSIVASRSKNLNRNYPNAIYHYSGMVDNIFMSNNDLENSIRIRFDENESKVCCNDKCYIF